MTLSDSDFYEKIFEAAGEGIYVTDSVGTIIWVNNMLTGMLGYTKEDLIGHYAAELMPADCCSPGADKGKLDALSERYFEKFMTEYRHRDGSRVSVEGRISVVRDHEGSYAGIVGVLRDITDREIAVSALRESEQKYRDLADSLPQIVFEIDMHGRIAFINNNACAAFGYSAEELRSGFNAFDLLVPEQRREARENLKRFFAGQSYSGNELIVLRKDGTTFPVLVHAARMYRGGAPAGVRGIMVDIEDRKKIDEELMKARRLQSIAALAGGVAEDFNTILSTILGNINIAQHQSGNDEQIVEALLIAERATLRAKDLTDQLFMFSRGAAFTRAPVQLDSVLRDVCGYALKGSQVQVHFDLAEDLWSVSADEAQIRQVCTNLIINADHAMPDGGLLTVSCENTVIGPQDNLALRDGSYVRIAIKDESIGILNEHVQHIFEPYFTGRRRGSGIGLATAYIVAKNHDGLIVAESEFGKGTTFYLYLPAQEG